MVEIHGAIAATIVKRRGSTRAQIGRAVGGIAGAALATRHAKANTPLQDQFGFVAVLADRVVLFKAKGAFMSKPTAIVLGERARTGATAHFKNNKSWGVLELFFEDGSLWEFDVPRAGLRDAGEVSDTLGQVAAVNNMDGDPPGHIA
jgi:hypothetical protein